MRIWSIHWRFLHRIHLQGLWREGLCGLKVINTDKGYSNHPQWLRFKALGKNKAKVSLAIYLLKLSDYVKPKYNYNFNKERVYEKLNKDELNILEIFYKHNNKHIHNTNMIRILDYNKAYYVLLSLLSDGGRGENERSIL